MVPGIVPNVLLFLGILWVFDCVALLPILLSGAVRRLFRTWPTDYLAPNYLAGVTGYAVSHLLWMLFPVALHGGSLERNVLPWLAGMTLLNLVLWWAAVAIGFPMLGLWHPKEGDEYDGRIALTLELFAYLAATGVLTFLFLVAVIAIGFPG